MLFIIFMDPPDQRIRQCQRSGRLEEPKEVKHGPAPGDREGAHLVFQGGTTITPAEPGHFRPKEPCCKAPGVGQGTPTAEFG